jgi:hypothetical protein
LLVSRRHPEAQPKDPHWSLPLLLPLHFFPPFPLGICF